MDADSLNKDHKQAEFSQDELLRKVDNINKELKEFVSIVLHDLKGPLRGIKALANWILSDCADKLGDQANEQMNLLLERVERMHNLIEGALKLPYSLNLQVAPTAGHIPVQDSQALYTTHRPDGY